MEAVKATRHEIAELKASLNAINVRTESVDRAIGTVQNSMQNLSVSKGSDAKGGNKTMAVNHRFTYLAKNASKDATLAAKWEEYKNPASVYASRFKNALDLATTQRANNGDSNKDDSAFNGRIASLLWSMLNESEKESFKTWSDSTPDIQSHWKQDKTGSNAESTVSTPANTNFGLGQPLSTGTSVFGNNGAAPTFDANAVLGGAGSAFQFGPSK